VRFLAWTPENRTASPFNPYLNTADTNRGRLKEFAKHHDRLYLFSASGNTIDGENIVNIDSGDLVDYICDRPQELDPTEIDRLRRRLDIYESTVES